MSIINTHKFEGVHTTFKKGGHLFHDYGKTTYISPTGDIINIPFEVAKIYDFDGTIYLYTNGYQSLYSGIYKITDNQCTLVVNAAVLSAVCENGVILFATYAGIMDVRGNYKYYFRNYGRVGFCEFLHMNKHAVIVSVLYYTTYGYDDMHVMVLINLDTPDNKETDVKKIPRTMEMDEKLKIIREIYPRYSILSDTLVLMDDELYMLALRPQEKAPDREVNEQGRKEKEGKVEKRGECCVCFEDIVENEWQHFDCTHADSMHYKCIKTLLACPICRADVK